MTQPASDAARTRDAILFMVAAGALVAGASALGKSLGVASGLGDALHPLTISAGRFTFALAALLAFILARPSSAPSLKRVPWALHGARSVCGWLGVTALFAAVAAMPAAEAIAISFLSPLATMALAAAFLNERIGLRKIVAAGIALAGAALILRPGGAAFQAAGLYALAAAGLMGLEAIFIKRLSDAEPPLRILIINNAIGAAVSVCAALMVWAWPSGGQWLMLAALGAAMACGQAAFIQSMKRGEASRVTPAFYSVLVFAGLYDFIFFGEAPGPIALLGAGLILGGAVVLALEARALRPSSRRPARCRRDR